MKIQVDSQIVAGHDNFPGSGRISQKKGQFEDLLKALIDHNVENLQIRVEKRDPSEYEWPCEGRI